MRDYVVQKHKKQTEFYENIILTKQIANIEIGNTPINKINKKLIVLISFISSFILALFLIFLFDVIKNRKEF